MMTHERSLSNKSRRQVAACRQAACVASDHARTADKASIGRYVCPSVRLSVCLLVCPPVPVCLAGSRVAGQCIANSVAVATGGWRCTLGRLAGHLCTTAAGRQATSQATHLADAPPPPSPTSTSVAWPPHSLTASHPSMLR